MSIAPARAQPGLVDPTFAAVLTNSVYDVVLQSDGRIVVLIGWPASKLVRLNPDGTPDPSFSVAVPQTNHVLAVQTQLDGKLVIAGDFSEIGGHARPCLARLNPDGSLDESFAPRLSLATVAPPPVPMPGYGPNQIWVILAQPDGKVLVSKMWNILASDGSPLPPLIRLNPDGTVDAGFAAVNLRADRLALMSNGKILAVENENGVYPGSARLVRLEPDGSTDRSFTSPDIAGWVNAIRPAGTDILVAGAVFRVNGIAQGCMCRLKQDGSLDQSFYAGLGMMSMGVTTLAPQPDGKVIVAGAFSIAGADYKNLVRLNQNGTLDTTYAAGGADSFVYALVQQPDGKLLIGGEFQHIGFTRVAWLARLTGDSQAGPGTFVLDAAQYEVFENQGEAGVSVRRIWGSEGDVSVNFRTLAESASAADDYLEQSGLLVFHPGETLKQIRIPIVQDSWIEDVETFRVELTDPAGGARLGEPAFTTVTILDDDGPASLDPSFSLPLRSLDGPVHAVAVQGDGKLVIGGAFQQACGVPRKAIARLNAGGSLDSAFDPGSGLDFDGYPAGWVNLLRLQPDGKVLLAGIFSSINGVERHYLARLEVNGSVDVSFDCGSGPRDNSLVGDVRGMELLTDGALIVGGGFTTFSGFAQVGLARLSSNGVLDQTFQPAIASIAVKFSMQPDEKVVYTRDWSRDVRRLNADGTSDSSFNASVDNPAISQVTSLPDGKTLVGGLFSTVNGVARDCVARLLPNGVVDTEFTADLSLFAGETGRAYVYGFAVQPDQNILLAVKSRKVPAGDYLVRLKQDGTFDSDFEPVLFRIPFGDNEVIRTIVVQNDGRILVGGEFQTVNGSARPYLARFKGGNKSGSRPLLVKSLSVSADQSVLGLAVAPGKPFVVQVSTDLAHWTNLSTNISLTSNFTVVDDFGSTSNRFYRVLQLVP